MKSGPSWSGFIFGIVLAVSVVLKIGLDNEANRTLPVMLGLQPRHPVLDPTWCLILVAAVIFLVRSINERKDT